MTAGLLVVLLTVTPANERKAIDLSRRSMLEYNAGDLENALAHATAAYELDPRPALLFNLGQCHRALEHWSKALFLYRNYLRESPRARNRALVLKLIAELEVKIGAQSAAAPAAPAVAGLPAPAPSPILVIAPRRTPDAPLRPAATAARPAKVEGRSRLPAYLAGALGLAVGLAGGGAILTARGMAANAGRGGTPPEGSTAETSLAGQVASANLWNTVGEVWVGMGLAGLVAAGILFALPSGGAQAHVAFSPLPGGGALALSGSF